MLVINLAANHPQWALGLVDDTSRVARPSLLQEGHELVEYLIEVHHCSSASSANSALASCRSFVSKPSVNQP
jgi:hypothetical protein